MLYMVTFTINIPQMLAYIPYMDPMGCIGTPFWELPPEKKNTNILRCAPPISEEKPGSPCRTDQSQFISVCFKRCRVEVVLK